MRQGWCTITTRHSVRLNTSTRATPHRCLRLVERRTSLPRLRRCPPMPVRLTRRAHLCRAHLPRAACMYCTRCSPTMRRKWHTYRPIACAPSTLQRHRASGVESNKYMEFCSGCRLSLQPCARRHQHHRRPHRRRQRRRDRTARDGSGHAVV